MIPAHPLASGSAPHPRRGAEPDAPLVPSLLELAHPGPLPARLEAVAALTLATLGPDAAEWVDHYQDRASAVSEDGFLEFVIARTDEPVLLSIARFERALSVARAARSVEPSAAPTELGESLRLHPAACTIDLPGPAEQVIGALALGLSVPPYAGWPVLVAPGLPTLWRRASALEDALCTWLTRPRPTAEVLARFPGAARVLPRLVEARALVVTPRSAPRGP